MGLKLSGIFGIVLSFIGASTAFAGGSSDGGGDAIICKTGIPVLRTLLGSKRVYLADTFFFLKAGGENLLPLLDEQQTLSSALLTLDAAEPGVADEIASVIQKLEFVEVDSVGELDDDNIVLDVPGCSKKQLAIQDVLQNRVRVNKKLYAKLSPGERALFKIHEAFIHIRKAPADTTPIRAAVRAIVEAPNFDGFVRSVVPKVTQGEVLRRTLLVFKRACGWREMPLIARRLDTYMTGSDYQFRTLAGLLEREFADQHVAVGWDMWRVTSEGMVVDLGEYIWNRIPEIFRAKYSPEYFWWQE